MSENETPKKKTRGQIINEKRWTKPSKGHSPTDFRLEDITAERRARVAVLIDQVPRPTLNQVWMTLSDPNSQYYLENPGTGKPYSKKTIFFDVDKLMERSLEEENRFMRRSVVKALRLRGLTYVEVHAALSDPKKDTYMLNPATGEPWSIGTVEEDLVWLREENYKIASEHTDNFRSEHLAVLQEVRRSAWAKGNLNMILRAIELEMKLMGSAMPEVRVNHNFNSNTSAMDTLRDKIKRLSHAAMRETAEDADIISQALDG